MFDMIPVCLPCTLFFNRFVAMDRQWLDMAEQDNMLDGSTVVVAFIIGKKLYVGKKRVGFIVSSYRQHFPTLPNS